MILNFDSDRSKATVPRIKRDGRFAFNMSRHRYLLLGSDYPIPAKLLKVDGELVSTTSGLLASFVAIKSHVSLDPRPSSRVEFLRLYFEVRRVFSSGISLHQLGVSAMISSGTGDLERYSQIIPWMFEPFGDHSS